MRLAALLFLTLVSCSTSADEPDTDQEQQAAQCTTSSCTEATGGKCMTVSTTVHMCAYPDATCTSGYRYDEVAGSQFSKACTPAQAPQDPPEDPKDPTGW